MLREKAFALDRSAVLLDEETAFYDVSKADTPSWAASPKGLRDYGLIVTDDGWTIGKAEPDTQYTSVPGWPGSVDTTITHRQAVGLPEAPYGKQREIKITVAAVGDPMQIHEAMLNVGALAGVAVGVGGLLPDPHLYFRGRLELDDWTMKYAAGGVPVAAETKLTVTADPYAYGRQRNITLSDGANTQTIEGNAPTRPFVELARKDGSTAAASIAYTEADTTMQAAIAPAENTRNWAFDCLTHDVYAYGAALNFGNREGWDAVPLTLASDWLELAAGKASLTLTNSDGGRLVYRPAYRL